MGLCSVSGKSFILVYVNMTTSIRFFLSREFSSSMDLLMDMFLTGFSLIPS